MAERLRDKVEKRKLSTPASVTEAYLIINGILSGDYQGAQVFLKSMEDEERKARTREEQRGTVRQKALERYGAKPVSRRFKYYL